MDWSVHSRRFASHPGGRRLRLLVKSGRAFVYPVFQASYERNERFGDRSHRPAPTAFYRDLTVMQSKDLGRTIDYLNYEHYAGMAEQELRRLAEEACTRWGLNALRLVHRVGRVPVGEESIVIVTAAGHRAEAFESARFMIEELKKKVPIWKAAPDP